MLSPLRGEHFWPVWEVSLWLGHARNPPVGQKKAQGRSAPLMWQKVPYRGPTMSLIAVRSSPSIVMSVKAGTQTRSTPPGATKPRAIATALTAWLTAPAPIA